VFKEINFLEMKRFRKRTPLRRKEKKIKAPSNCFKEKYTGLIESRY